MNVLYFLCRWGAQLAALSWQAVCPYHTTGAMWCHPVTAFSSQCMWKVDFLNGSLGADDVSELVTVL